MKRCFFIFISLLALSCSRPSSYETFVLREKAEYGDTYSFNLDCHDTLVSYDLDLYTRLERQAFGNFSTDSLDLSVKWISPSDSIHSSDTLVLHLGVPIDSSYFSKDYICPFRKDFMVSEQGIWRVRIHIRNNPDELRGLGVIFKSAE